MRLLLDRTTWTSRRQAFASLLMFLGLLLSSCESSSVLSPTRKADTPAFSPLFVDVSRELGLEFHHTAGDPEHYYFPSIMSGGGAFLDFDNDGRLDIYLINGNHQLQGPDGESSTEPIINRLYRQNEEGHFVDMTESSGLGDPGFGMGVAVADVNNDGFSDVFVTNYGPDQLFLNQRNATFANITESVGIDNIHWSASASFLDFDRDGWLDLFVTNYINYYAERTCHDMNGEPDFCGPQIFFSTTDRLFRNVTGEQRPASLETTTAEAHEVKFEDVSRQAGIALSPGAGLGVACADFDGDGWTDIYVANDRMANFLWMNQHDGTFIDEAVPRGAAFDLQGRPQASMGIAVGDVDGNMAMDLYVTHLEGESNAFYLNDGHGIFSEVSAKSGLLEATFPYTSFGTAFTDIDHDSKLDLIVVNGRVKRAGSSVVSSSVFWDNYAEQNRAFFATGGGQFVEHSLGDDSEVANVSRGLATGDFDRDGDLDVLVTNTAGPVQLLRNEADKSGGWMKIKAIDPKTGGRDAYGAIVKISAGHSEWTQLIQPGSSYLSSSEPVAHFGLGTHRTVDQIIVLWPEGTRESFPGGSVNVSRVLERGAGESSR